MAASKDCLSPDTRAFLEASNMNFALFRLVGDSYETVLVSQGFCRLFGQERQELMRYLTNKSYRMMHPDDAGKLIEATRGFATRDDISTVCRVWLKESWHPVLFHERPQPLPDGTTLYFVTYTDLIESEQTSDADYQDYLAQQQEHLYRDELTGLPNINYYQAFATGTLKELLDRGLRPSVLFFDIQGMHYYNDRFGYEQGDQLLRLTAAAIRDAFPGELCVRYTEDHFVVITRHANAFELVGQVRRKVKSLAPDSAADLKAGVYTCSDPMEDGVATVDRARRAMEFIRRTPDVHVRLYDEEVSRADRMRTHILGSYRKAIQEGWIKVYYQPLVSSMSGKVSHCEALARWVDPTYGFLSPADFIGILEESHRIWELDLHVLDCVCRDIRACKEAGRPYPYASVNISRHDLRVPDIHERIMAILQAQDVTPEEVSIEITESALVDHEELIESHIRRFHEEGFQVWLDDFGSGYSSFNAVQNFDFDLLKIDMQFLRNQNQRTPDILADIVDMTKRLGIRSVTEGVETLEQGKFLRQIGCGLLQGFYYSKPIPGDRFHEELGRMGLAIETEEERTFYEQLMRINVLNVDKPLPESNFGRLGGDRSITLMVEEGGRTRYVYTNEAGTAWMRALGISSLDQISDLSNANPMPVHRTIRACMEQLHEVGDTVTSRVDDPNLQGRMEMELVGKAGGRRGYMICCYYMRKDEAAG